MLTNQPIELSLIEREKRRPSVFRPPKFFKASLPKKKGLTATAQPWFPTSADAAAAAEEKRQASKPMRAAPVAVGHSPMQNPRLDGRLPPALNQLLPSSPMLSGLFSPLSTPVNTFFHSFSDAATEQQVYPMDMFLSVRKDASHTPHGVLKWCMRQYVAIPTLKVPTHLQLSMNEAVNATDGVTRGALGSGLKTKLRNKPIRQTHHKVMSVLSRITRAKYNELLEELVQLPLRQSDDGELQEVVKVFFDKSVQEHDYSDMYAQLVKKLCTIRESERDLDPKLQDRLLGNRMRTQLMAACDEQFRRPIELTPDEKVDRTTGVPFSAEEIDMKRTRMKNRLVGNIKFVGELYKMDLVTDRVIENILCVLVGSYSPLDPMAKEEYVFEVFVTLIRTVVPLLKDRRPHVLAHYLGISKTVERSHPRPRVRFLLMNLADTNEKERWVPTERVMREAKAYCDFDTYPTPGTPLSTTSLSSSGGHFGAPAGRVPAAAAGLKAHHQQQFSPTASGADSLRSSSFGQTPAMPEQSPPYRMHGHPQSSANASSNSMSASASAADLGIGIPRSRSSAASLHASAAASTATPATAATPSAAASAVTITAPAALATPTRAKVAGVSANLAAAKAHTAATGSKESINSGRNVITGNGASVPDRPTHALAMPFTPVEKQSPFMRPMSVSEMSSACTSDGTRTPIAMRHHRAAVLARLPAASGAGAPDTVNLQDVTQQLIELYNDPAQAASVVNCINEMVLRNKVLCLTWWMRLVATTTARFAERQRFTNLLCDILSSCPALKPEELFVAVVEWMRFDIELSLYDYCPRMFDNIAHMVLYCHSPDVSHLPNIEVAREVLHGGLFNIMLHALTTDRGTDQIVTLIKSAHPVSMALLHHFVDPAEEAAVLRMAVENRFRLLPYFLSVSNGTESDLPGTPASGCRTPTTPSLRSPLGDSITSTVHYDPLSRCLSFQRVADDPELQLFRKIRGDRGERGGDSAASWREEAVKLALAPAGNGSTVAQVIQVMKVVGALLACTSVTHHAASLITFAEVDATVKEVLARRPGTVFEAATLLELVMHFTQALSSGKAGAPRKSTRIKPLRQAFARWSSQEIVHRGPATELIRAMETTAPFPRVFTTYHNAIADSELQWHSTLTCL